MKWIILSFFLALAALGCRSSSSDLTPQNPQLVPPTPTPCVPTAALYRVNCGDLAYTDYCGNVWAADQPYSTWGYATAGNIGGPGTTGIEDTLNDPLFYKERYAPTLEYRFDVPAGTYQVVLWFSEGYFTAPGSRIFNVVVEGVSFASALDVFAQVGGKRAYSLSGSVPVSDGTLNIVMTASADNAEINAIEVK